MVINKRAIGPSDIRCFLNFNDVMLSSLIFTLVLVHHDWQGKKGLHIDTNNHLWFPSHCASQSLIPRRQLSSEEIPGFDLAWIVRLCRSSILSPRIPS